MHCLVFLLLLATLAGPCQTQLNNYEVQVLMVVKQSFIDPQNETSGWDSGFTDPCTWHHVTCSSDLPVVTRLELGRLQLSGTVSPDISKLTSLMILSLEGNNLTGAIPPEIGRLSNLNALDLSGNHLSGLIPSSFGQLKSLNTLQLNNNSLQGPIPASLASIATLASVDFSYNNLSGQVPHLSAILTNAEGNQYLCGNGTGRDCPGQEQSLPLNASQGVKSKSSHTKNALIVCSVLVLAVCLIGITICLWCKKGCQRPYDEHKELDTEMCLGQLKRYSWHELLQATDDFSINNLLGTGGSGQVYKGRLEDGSVVAVKRFKDRHFVAQFKVELEMISLAAHRNLLRLLGYCSTSTELALIYPYMSNGSVASRLREKPALDWPTRKCIALGSARGLVYLHEQCDPKIIHGDVKAANILLDEAEEAVVADFGLSRFLDHSVSHVTTVVRGTIGYLAPETFSGQISAKTDVYSYGILLLELIAGQTEIGLRRLSGQKLLDWVRKSLHVSSIWGTVGLWKMCIRNVKKLYQEKRLRELVDEELRRKGGYGVEELEGMVQVALLCTLSLCADRPKMSEVLQMLEGDGLSARWETWQKSEEERCNAMEQKIAPSYLDLQCDTSHIIELQLSGPR